MSKKRYDTHIKIMVLSLFISIFAIEKQVWCIEKAQKKRIYLKGGIGGGGVEDIPLKMFLETGEEVKVERWTGRHLNLEIGYHINPKMSIETGLGWHSNRISDKIIGGDGHFRRTALAVTGIYRFYRDESLGNIYGGFGMGYYIAPKLYRKGPGIKTTVYYEDVFGPHLTIGGMLDGEKSLLFIDFKYAFGIKYKFKEGEENGVKFTLTQLAIPQWREINGSGLSFNLGGGWKF